MLQSKHLYSKVIIIVTVKKFTVKEIFTQSLLKKFIDLINMAKKKEEKKKPIFEKVGDHEINYKCLLLPGEISSLKNTIHI